MHAYVVIGANYGDEGKGLITDYLVRKTGANVVCRFNGGAQAGHTVVSPEGERHVFHHVASGFYAGADTYLGRRFVVNPLVLRDELQQLNGAPNIYVHPDAQVSTIFDMLLNTAVETARGVTRHGSCGLGINETVTRSLSGFGLEFQFATYLSENAFANVLKLIAERWVPQRVEQLGLQEYLASEDSPLKTLLSNPNYELLAKDMISALKLLGHRDDYFFMRPLPNQRAPSVIFEGAQGLAIDEQLGEFPHVTRSLTGLPYAIEAAKEVGVTEVTPVYVTRVYATRHGAGPLPNDHVTFDANIVDETNIPNEWQGTIKIAPLSIQELHERIRDDVMRGETLGIMHNVKIKSPVLAITCLDQIERSIPVEFCGETRYQTPSQLVETLTHVCKPAAIITSYGPASVNVSSELFT